MRNGDSPLRRWLREKKLTDKAFGARIGTTGQAVARYADKNRVPTPEVMRQIILATGGAITPNDFYTDVIERVRPRQ